MQTLIVDNYDSFTYNLYQLIGCVNGQAPLVVRNDQLPWEDLKRLRFDNLVISPGPGHPGRRRDFGVSREALLQTDRPVLGICLGHQGLALLYGASVIHAPQPMHGRSSEIFHSGTGLFADLPQRFSAVRYHSLIVDGLSGELECSAWTREGLVMGIRHRQRPLFGVQFHPESICTEHGARILENFLSKTRRHMISVPEAIEHSGATLAQRSSPVASASRLSVRARKLSFFRDPEDVFVQFYGVGSDSFWLDTARHNLPGQRFSYMGDASGPASRVVEYKIGEPLRIRRKNEVLTTRESIFEYLERELAQRQVTPGNLPFDFNGGFVGYFGYEMKGECGGSLRHRAPRPDAIFIFADRLLVFDHRENEIWLVCLGGAAADAESWFTVVEAQLLKVRGAPELVALPQTTSVKPGRDWRHYLGDIDKCLAFLRDGETYELCLTNQLHIEAEVDALTYYRSLRALNPAPYAAFLRFSDFAIACSSPEMFLRIDAARTVTAKPIKGTLRRGLNAAEDNELALRLRADEKCRAENLMIVDLLRNDLGRVCEIGSVGVGKLMDVESYANVHQLVSTIVGRLSEQVTPVECIRAAFPGGSMTGAPKLRTMELIDEVENEARGVYSGAIGYLGVGGSAHLNITIRTAVITESELSIGTGGAIVALSDPVDEVREALLKVDPLLQALARIGTVVDQ